MSEIKQKQVLLRDLDGFLYLMPTDETRKYRIAPEKLPEILEQVTQEMPEIDWEAKLSQDRVGRNPAAVKAVDVGISLVGSVAAAKAVEKYNDCCVADCCVADCCVGDCCVIDCGNVGDSCANLGGVDCRPVE